MIGIGGHLAVPPLPHHLATATVEADLDRAACRLRSRTGGRQMTRRGACSAIRVSLATGGGGCREDQLAAPACGAQGIPG